jgi:hypothetical protein
MRQTAAVKISGSVKNCINNYTVQTKTSKSLWLMTTFCIKDIPGANSTSVRSMMQHVILRRFRNAETGVEHREEVLYLTHSLHVNLEHFFTDVHTKSAETK